MTINSAMLSRDLGRVRELRALNHLDVAQRLERCERERTLLVASLRDLACPHDSPPSVSDSISSLNRARALLRELGEVKS